MKRILIVLAAVAAVCSCCRKPDLVILHCNDTHSHLEPDRGGPTEGQGGVIERAAFIDSVRNAEGESNVLLLHAGDFNQGSSYFSEFGGDVEVKLVNALKYDCITLGNHELDNGIEDLLDRVKRINCPVVCANLDFRPFGADTLIRPYVILEKAQRKIGIIGLETDITTNVSKLTSSRIQQLDPVEVTNKWADKLRNEDKCDLVILLSHQGYEEDQAIVAASRNLDLVVGGHTHTKVDDFIFVKDLDGREVGIVTDWKWGLEMGKITVR